MKGKSRTRSSLTVTNSNATGYSLLSSTKWYGKKARTPRCALFDLAADHGSRYDHMRWWNFEERIRVHLTVMLRKLVRSTRRTPTEVLRTRGGPFHTQNEAGTSRQTILQIRTNRRPHLLLTSEDANIWAFRTVFYRIWEPRASERCESQTGHRSD